MQHVDTTKIKTDVQARFEFLSKFLKFGKDDIAVLNKAAPALVPLVPTVVDAIYANLWSFDATKNVFIQNKVHFKGNTTTTPGGSELTPERITALKDTLAAYFKKVLTESAWDKAFLDYLSQLGKVHANKAEANNVDVSYTFMNVTLGYAAHVLVDALLGGAGGFDEATKKAAILALNKFVWIQNDFFTMHYIP